MGDTRCLKYSMEGSGTLMKANEFDFDLNEKFNVVCVQFSSIFRPNLAKTRQFLLSDSFRRENSPLTTQGIEKSYKINQNSTISLPFKVPKAH